MDDEKNNASVTPSANEGGAAQKGDIHASMTKTNEYNEQTLNDELEKLAETFRTELKKAQESESEVGELIQQLDDENIIDPANLCSCCGERERDRSFGENYEYCAECREAMKHYPIEFYRYIIAFAVIFAAVISVLCFGAEYEGFSGVKKARAAVGDGKRTAAVEYYTAAKEFFDGEDCGSDFISLEAAKQLSVIMPKGLTSMNEIVSYVEEALGPVSSRLPVNASYVKMRENALVLSSTLQAFYGIVQKDEYASFDGKDKATYEKIMTEIDSLIDQSALIPDMNNSENTVEVSYDEGMVRFAQYMFAYSSGNFDDAYYYIKQVKELKPEYIWLYAYELGIIEVQKGNFDEAEKLASELEKLNADDVFSYEVRAFSARMQHKFEKSVEYCDKALAINETASDLYRQRAMAYILLEDYDKAIESVKTGLSYEEYAALYCVYYVAAVEKGDTALADELAEQLESFDVGLGERMQNYADKKITAYELFAEGTGDIE